MTEHEFKKHFWHVLCGSQSPQTKAYLKDEDYVKCPRCWNYHYYLYNFDQLCDRCQTVILEVFPNHDSVSHIKVCMEKQALLFHKDTSLENRENLKKEILEYCKKVNYLYEKNN